MYGYTLYMPGEHSEYAVFLKNAVHGGYVLYQANPMMDTLYTRGTKRWRRSAPEEHRNRHDI